MQFPSLVKTDRVMRNASRNGDAFDYFSDYFANRAKAEIRFEGTQG